ncbi:MAG: phosphatase PAP2 family protein [Thermoprotei archaeon]|nr:phosphatase PAP2 family protein [Thermoprotei archaeon]
MGGLESRVSLALYAASLALLVTLPLFYFLHVREYWVLLSFLGSTEFYVFILPIVYHSLPRGEAAGLAFSLLAAAGFAGFAKDVVKLPRPPQELWLVGAEGYGFPSGHATGSSSFWGYMALSRPAPALIGFSVMVIVGVSLSRIVLGVHYPRDVVGGIVIGFAVAALSLYLASRVGWRLALAGIPVSLAFLALSLLGYGVFSAPSTLLGFSLAELLLERVKLRDSPGALYGALGSMAAAPFAIVASKSGILIVEVSFFALAGFLAVAVPRYVKLSIPFRGKLG